MGHPRGCRPRARLAASPPTDHRLEHVARDERAACQDNPADPDLWRAKWAAEQKERNQWGGYWVLADAIAAGAWAVASEVPVDGRVILLTGGGHCHIGAGRLWPTPDAFNDDAGWLPPDGMLRQIRQHEHDHGLSSNDATIVVVDGRSPDNPE